MGLREKREWGTKWVGGRAGKLVSHQDNYQKRAGGWMLLTECLSRESEYIALLHITDIILQIYSCEIISCGRDKLFSLTGNMTILARDQEKKIMSVFPSKSSHFSLTHQRKVNCNIQKEKNNWGMKESLTNEKQMLTRYKKKKSFCLGSLFLSLESSDQAMSKS